MDLNHNISGEGEEDEEDRISGLPDSILHYILSFLELDIQSVARTCILSKRWNYIWRSIPTFDFIKPSSPSDIDKFMDFVDRTLLLRDPLSSIQTVYLHTDTHFNASRVHSWICNIASRNLKILHLFLHLDKPFFLPLSLFKCESLTKLDLTATSTTTVHFPKTLCFPKLKRLLLRGIKFTDVDCCNCPVLKVLSFEDCVWSGIREFCILTPKLKLLDINNDLARGYGLQDCHLKICAPSLVSLAYRDNLAKDYDLSTFATLDDANVHFDGFDERNEQWIGYGAAVTKFFRAISHVKILRISADRLQVFLDADDFTNELPTFHNLSELDLISGPARDNLIFALLKAAPNLESLEFGAVVFDDEDDGEDDDIVCDQTEELFRHLQSVHFREFSGEARELRWAKLILKNAKSLQIVTIENDGSYAKGKQEAVMSELSSLPRASGGCVFKSL